MNPNVPPELDAVIDRALAKDRDRRYQSMDELKAELGRLRPLLEPRDSDPLGVSGETSAFFTPPEGDALAAPPAKSALSLEAPTLQAELAVIEPWDAVARDARDFLERGAGVLCWFRVPLGGIAYPVGFRSSLQPALENRRIREIRLVLDSAGGATPQIWSKQVMPLIRSWAKRRKRALLAHTEAHRGRFYDPSTNQAILSWIITDLSTEFVPSFKLFLSSKAAGGAELSQADADGSEVEIEILLATTVRNVRTGDGSQHTLRVPDAVLRTRTSADEGLVATLTRIARRWDAMFE
jgi:hypothetical protein